MHHYEPLKHFNTEPRLSWKAGGIMAAIIGGLLVWNIMLQYGMRDLREAYRSCVEGRSASAVIVFED